MTRAQLEVLVRKRVAGLTDAGVTARALLVGKPLYMEICADAREALDTLADLPLLCVSKSAAEQLAAYQWGVLV